MIKLTDKIEEIKKQEYWAEYLEDYSYDEAYICDAIDNCADDNLDIYDWELYKYLSENPETVEETINEYGWEGCGGTLLKATQMAQFIGFKNQMYDSLPQILEYLVLKKLKTLELKYITEGQYNNVLDCCKDVDVGKTFEEFIEETTVNAFGKEFMEELKQ